MLEEVKVFNYPGSLVTAEGEKGQMYSKEFLRGVKYWER